MNKLTTALVCLFLATFTFGQTPANNKASTEVSAKTTKRGPVFRATKEQISLVQQKLKDGGSYSGEVSGKFNDDFRKSIKDFQSKNGLRKTGTLNRATLEKMGVELTEKQRTYPVNPRSFDSNDDSPTGTRKKSFRPTKAQITEAQTKLKTKGKFDGGATGRYSKEFRASLKAFQEEEELKRTGKLDEATLDALKIELTDRQKGIEPEPKSGSSTRRTAFRVNKEQISRAQKILTDKKLFAGEINGKYSKDLRLAIKDFQSANDLKRKGSLNRATLEKLGVALTEKQKGIPVNPNDIAKPKDPNSSRKGRKIFRATKNQIIRVQAMLRDKGLYAGEETGKLNPETRAAIREWQAQNNVKKTGTLNKVTLEAMKIELTEKQKEL